jgi:glutaminase
VEVWLAKEGHDGLIGMNLLEKIQMCIPAQLFGAMLANNGINPSTGERIVEPETVKATVTLMQTCGMYNGAGKFTKDHGVPTKSGVSGGLMTVIPGIGAFATWSPPLNEEGNCVRGIGMIEQMSKIYNNINLFHKD